MAPHPTGNLIFTVKKKKTSLFIELSEHSGSTLYIIIISKLAQSAGTIISRTTHFEAIN
jgi:hypothetical protein